MSSPEDKAYEIMRELDVGYVLVIFGGLTGYASDGIVGFNWIVIVNLLKGFVLMCALLLPYRYQQVPMDGPYRGQHREGSTY